MANATELEVLFAWLIEEVGELGRTLIRKRSDSGDPKLEFGDVWNCLHALAFKAGFTPAAVKAAAMYKDKHHKERTTKEGESQDTSQKDESNGKNKTSYV